jgi:diphosphomevalonate decarboxylase
LKSVTAEGYSNIALIKYMGKIDHDLNAAANPSFSYTLPHLKSVVRVSEASQNSMQNPAQDQWSPLTGPGLQALELSEKGQAKFLKHVERLKAHWNYHGPLLIESANNFPADCGIASSASSFAALTLSMAKFMSRPESASELAVLSRQGSGSSCRSFFSPWCLWQGSHVEPVELPYSHCLHLAVIIDGAKKEVSSSEAHRRVASSPEYSGRAQRVQMRMEKLLGALKKQEWSEAFGIVWDEFEDMHRLFETSQPSFSYRQNQATNQVLEDCKKVWSYKKDGPLVTMDAGPNVHLIFREDQENMYMKMKKYFSEKHLVLGSL